MVALFGSHGLPNLAVTASAWLTAWTESWRCRQELPGKLARSRKRREGRKGLEM